VKKIITKKKLLSLSLVLTLLFQISSVTYAGNVTPQSSDMTGYEYIEKRQSKEKTIEFEHAITNPKSISSSVTYSYQRSIFTESSASTSASFNAMVAEVGIGTEINLGGSSTKTFEVHWDIPPDTSVVLYSGSEYVKTTGTENYWNKGKIQSTKSVTGEWTYRGWSSAEEI